MKANPYTVQTAEGELEGMLKGTTLNNIQNIYGVFNRAARQLLLDLDPQETMATVETNTFYTGVWDYTAPPDLKGDRVVDIRPQVNRQLWDVFLQRYGQDFDVNKSFSLQEMFTVQWQNGVKTIRVNAPNLAFNVLVNGISSVNGNGVWTGSSQVSGIATDNVNYADQSAAGSLVFNLASGSNPQTAYLVNSTQSAVDLTSYQNQGAFFLYVYFPTGADFSQVQVQIGSDSANYWTFTATQNQEGNAFENGWNMVQFNWLATTPQTGTPAVNALNYVKVLLTYNGNSETAVRLNGLWCRIGLQYDIIYYSKYMFSDGSTNVFKETVSQTSDYINLDTDSYNLYLYQLAYQAALQVANQNSEIDVATYKQNYLDALLTYKTKYASQAQKNQDTYYQLPNRRWTNYLGKNYFG